MPPGSGAYDLLAKIGGDGPWVCAKSDARLVVLSPDGERFADLVPSAINAGSGSGNSGCAKKEEHAISLAGGEWRVEFSGSGPFSGIFDLKPTA